MQGLDQVVEDDIGYQPTAQVLHGLDDLFDVDFLSEPRLSDVAPSTLITWYGTEEGGWFRREVGGDASLFDPILTRLDRVIAHLSAADARLLFSSDTPSAIRSRTSRLTMPSRRSSCTAVRSRARSCRRAAR